MTFDTKLCVEEIDTRPGHWRLVWALVYHGRGVSVTVPQGYETDFASTPRILWPIFPPTGHYSKASVVHDYAYSTQRFSRRIADALLYEISLECRTPPWIAFTMWAAVRLFGWSHWRKRRRR